MNELTMKPIARIRTAFPEKFGVPRQSALGRQQSGMIIFEPEFRKEGILKGITAFSHLWILWGFEHEGTWHPQIRPPKLGASEKRGVFATRSPLRPNPVALSAVKLEEVRHDPEYGEILTVSGIDMTDNTVIYDIKPYIPAYDSIPDARDDFTQLTNSDPLTVLFETNPGIPAEEQKALREILSLDPRPGYHHDPGRIYGLAWNGYNVRFFISGGCVHVTGIEKAVSD